MIPQAARFRKHAVRRPWNSIFMVVTYQSVQGAQMAKHILSKAEVLRGLRGAIRTIEQKRGGTTPKWLLPGMRRFARRLKDEVAAGRGTEPIG